jgi:hypothetical protein
MPVMTIEASVLHALKAYKIEKGMPEKAAAAWATAKLNEGVARVNAVLAQHKRDLEAGTSAAFVDLKAWAQSAS